MKTIVIAGYYRTGSTWLFNVVKHSLLDSGFTVSQAGDHEPPETECDFHIVKTHTWTDELFNRSDFVFTSHRDLGDIKASYERFTGRVLEGDDFDRSWMDYLRWNSFTNYAMSFGTMCSNPVVVTKNVIRVLGIEANAEDVHRIVSEIKPPREGYDHESFYYSNHITKEP